MLVARISLTLSRYFSLSFIASGRFSGQHPVSSHSCWKYVRAGRPAFTRPCMGVHKSTSLMSSSLLLQQCPACLVRLTWIVFVIGSRWPYSWCLVGCCRQDLFKIAIYIYIYILQSWTSIYIYIYTDSYCLIVCVSIVTFIYTYIVTKQLTIYRFSAISKEGHADNLLPHGRTHHYWFPWKMYNCKLLSISNFLGKIHFIYWMTLVHILSQSYKRWIGFQWLLKKLI